MLCDTGDLLQGFFQLTEEAKANDHIDAHVETQPSSHLLRYLALWNQSTLCNC